VVVMAGAQVSGVLRPSTRPPGILSTAPIASQALSRVVTVDRPTPASTSSSVLVTARPRVCSAVHTGTAAGCVGPGLGRGGTTTFRRRRAPTPLPGGFGDAFTPGVFTSAAVREFVVVVAGALAGVAVVVVMVVLLR
jgi:hypothetical protein